MMQQPSSARPTLKDTAGGPQMGIASSFKDLFALRKYDPPELEVCEPQIKTGGATKHHVYKVKGIDHNGVIEVQRRFNHFYLLRDVLFERFFGLYVPPIP